MEEIRIWLSGLLQTHVAGWADGPLFTLLTLGIVIVCAVVVELLLRLVLMTSLPKLIGKIFKNGADFINKKIIGLIIRIISVSVLSGLLSLPFPLETNPFRKLLTVILGIYTIVLVVQLVANVLAISRSWMIQSPKYRNSPFVNLFQVFQVAVYFIAGLLIVSLLFGIDIKTVFGSLAALSAVLMLVFKDTIMGFVAGIQLSSNDMIRVGDWITSPKHGVDGDVMDITLTTVKVRAFDNTVWMIPPYALVSDPVINWRGMQETGARRCKRALYIDIRSVRYADDALIAHLKGSSVLGEYIDTVTKEIEADNAKLSAHDELRRRRLTNLGLFRRYIYAYLKGHPKVSQTNTVMVRQRDATDKGIPLELYFFTNTSAWIAYEDICSDIFDHLYSVAHHFDVNFFQVVSGRDLRVTPIEETKSDVPKAQA